MSDILKCGSIKKTWKKNNWPLEYSSDSKENYKHRKKGLIMNRIYLHFVEPSLIASLIRTTGDDFYIIGLNFLHIGLSPVTSGSDTHAHKHTHINNTVFFLQSHFEQCNTYINKDLIKHAATPTI